MSVSAWVFDDRNGLFFGLLDLSSETSIVANTHEFDQLPVRHNEEHLNAELSEDVSWGADASFITNPNRQRSEYVNLDVMAAPHTK